MKLHEYEGIDIFENIGIHVPKRFVGDSVDALIKAAEKIGYPAMLKAQVLVGGRGLAGGIKAVNNHEELKKTATELFNTKIKGLSVKEIMLTEKVDIAQELYMGITLNGYSGKPIAVVSTEGGVLIEETAKKSPDKMASLIIDPKFGFYPYQANQVLRQAGLEYKYRESCAAILMNLYKVFSDTEAILTEINPLAILTNGKLMALDSVIDIDDSAVFRVKNKLNLTVEGRINNEFEKKGKEIGVTYVDLDGDIGIISSGAGLGMASMDIIGSRLKPANFLETGGGITADLLYKCMKLIMMKPLKAIFINIYGGINPIHEGAKGVVRYIMENKVNIPIVAKALGNHQEETWEILKSGGVHVVTKPATEEAVEHLIAILTKEEK